MATMRKIGATIALEGESAFKKSVSACTTSLKTMKSELSLVSKQYADNANSLEALQAQHDALNKVLEQSQRVEQETASALLNSQQNYAKAGDQLDEYRKQLTDAEKALNDMLDAQSKTGDVDDSAVKAQQDEVQRLTDMIARGEKEYEKAGNNIEAWQQKLNAARGEVIDLKRQIAENEKYMEEAKNSTDGCATSIDQYGKKVKEAGDKSSKAMKDAADAAKEASDKMGTFFTAEKIEEYAGKISEAFQSVVSSAYEASVAIEEGYDRIAKNTGATGTELEQFKSIANNIYGNMPMEMEQIGDTIGQVNQRFNVQGDTLEALSTKFLKFADITGADIPENVGLAQRVMDAFGDDASKASDYLDVLAYTAQQTGADIGELQENTLEQSAALQELGVDSMAAINFMGKLQTSGIHTEAAMGALEDAYDTCKEQGKDFASTLLEVQDELLNNENEAEANQKAYDLFGESFAKVASAIRNGQVDFRDLANSMNVLDDASGAVDNTFEDTTHTWDDMTVAINNLKKVGAEMVDEVLDVAAPAVQTLADVLGEANDAFQSMPEPVQKTVTTVGLLTTTCGIVVPKLISVLQTVKALKEAGTVSKQIDDLRKAIDKLRTVDKAADTVSDVADSVENLTDIAKTATTGKGSIKDVAEAVEDVTDAARKADTVSDVAESVKNVSSAASSGSGAMSKFLSSLKGITGIAAPIIAVLTACGIAFKENTDAIVESDESLMNYFDTADEYIEKSKEMAKSSSDVKDEYEKTIAEIQSKGDISEPIEEALKELQEQTSKTNSDIDQMGILVDKLNTLYPDLGLSIDNITGKLYQNGKEVEDITVLLSKYRAEAEAAAKVDYAKDSYTELTNNQLQQKINAKQIELLKKQREEIENADIVDDGKGGVLLGGGSIGNGASVRGAWAKHKELDGIDDRINELRDANEGLAESEKELQLQVQATEEVLREEENAKESNASTTEDTARIVTGLGDTVDNTANQYMELVRRIQESDGDLDAVAASFGENETALKELFNNTTVAWQNSHDTIKSGLADEVASLSENSGAWASYRDSVLDSLQTTSSMFEERTTDDSVTWDTMMGNLTANADAYAQWNENVNSILTSARYANDEAFREIANTIMLGGIDSSEYLQQFVDNVDLSTAQASDDIQQFAEMQGVQDTFAANMANLQTATENGTGAIAAAFDNTKTEAENSLQGLATSMQEQADLYNNFVQYTNDIINDQRYLTDANFREYANTLMAQGIAGAEQVKALWDGMKSGSAEVDQAVQAYATMRDAEDAYADTISSMEVATNTGMDNIVTIVGNSGEAWKIAARNNSDLMASGIDMDKLERTVTLMSSKANNAIERTFADEETKSEVKSAGYDVGYNYGEGVLNGCNDALNGEIDGAPLATLLRQDVINALGREFED